MANKKLTDATVPVATTTDGLVLYGAQDNFTKRVPPGLLGGGGGGDSPFVTPQQFGAVGDNVTNDGPAFLAALAHLKANAVGPVSYTIGANKLYIPKGRYFLGTTTIDLTFGCIIEGDGENASILRWTAGTTGIRGQAYNTSGGSTTDTVTHYGAAGSQVRNLCLVGGYTNGAESEAHGIHIRNQMAVSHVHIYNFPGDGINISATAGGGAPIEGNANCFLVEHALVQGCRNGLFVQGADANAGKVDTLNAISNRQWGVWDSSFLGNTYIACHTATNGWEGAANSIATGCSYNGKRYYPSLFEAAGASTNPPTGTSASNQWWLYKEDGGPYAGVPVWSSGMAIRTGGGYRSDDLNAVNLFLGCYYEGDQNPSQFFGRALCLGGFMVNRDITGQDFSSQMLAGPAFPRTVNIGEGILFGQNGSTGSLLQSFGGMAFDSPNTVFKHNGAFAGQFKSDGFNLASALKVGDNKVVGARGSGVPDPTGGSVVDVEARAAISALLARLRPGGHGLIADGGTVVAPPVDTGFTPASLTPRAWYDPSDLSTMFQDTAGTVPVTAAGQPVARINDKSGNDFHAIQGTAGDSYRPILRVVGGKYYLESTSADTPQFFRIATNPLDGATAATAIYGFTPTEVSNKATLSYWGSSNQESYEPFAGLDFYSDFGSTTRPNFGALGGDTTTPNVMRLVRNATNVIVHRSRVLVGSQATSIGWKATDIVLGPEGGGGNFYGATFVNRLLTAGETTDLENYYALKTGVSLP